MSITYVNKTEYIFYCYWFSKAHSLGNSKEAVNISKMGRPTTNPRDKKIGFRMSEKEINDIQICSEKLNVNRVDAVIAGIRLLKKELNIED